MNIAVTGASGHIGNNLVRSLVDAGHKVRVLLHRPPTSDGAPGDAGRALADVSCEHVLGDVCDPVSLKQAISGADHVYHLAAHISISPDEDSRCEPVNVEGTRNVVTACREAGIRRLIHFSSVHALWCEGIGHREGAAHPIDERHELADRPEALPYDRSKARSEKVVLAAVAEGLDAVIVNPGAVIGRHDYRPSAQGSALLDWVKGRVPALVEGGYNWVDVRDVVSGAIAAAERGRRGERYLLTGHPLSFQELAGHLETASGKRMPRFVTPLWLARMASPLVVATSKLLGTRPLVTPYALQIIACNYHFKHDKAKAELGYTPRPIEDTLGDMLAWYRSAGYL